MNAIPLHSQEHESHNNDVDDIDNQKYIVFRIGEEIYATKLLSVREVVEELPIKTLPNTIRAFKGVCNLRGQIVGVIDLSAQFKVEKSECERPVLLVFDSESGALAVEIDHIETVTIIPPEDIEAPSGLLSAVENQFIQGYSSVMLFADIL